MTIGYFNADPVIVQHILLSLGGSICKIAAIDTAEDGSAKIPCIAKLRVALTSSSSDISTICP